MRDADGEPFAYIVSADELHRLQAQVETLRRQRDGYAAQLADVLRRFAPPPPTEAEIRAATANPLDMPGLIAELECRG